VLRSGVERETAQTDSQGVQVAKNFKRIDCFCQIGGRLRSSHPLKKAFKLTIPFIQSVRKIREDKVRAETPGELASTH
jgi:hypothetical protein